MTSSADRTRPRRWSPGIEAIARCAWLLALLFVAGTALSRAHAEHRLPQAEDSQEALISAEIGGFEAWSAVETTAPGRVSLSSESSATYLGTLLEEDPRDVGGPEESEAEATPLELASTSSRSGPPLVVASVVAGAPRTFVRGPYAARAPPRLA